MPEAARKVIVHIGTSADGYIARPDGDLGWLTSRPAPPGFYGMNDFMKSIDTELLGRKTYEASLRLGATFGGKNRTIVFSPRPACGPPRAQGVVDAESSLKKRTPTGPGGGKPGGGTRGGGGRCGEKTMV